MFRGAVRFVRRPLQIESGLRREWEVSEIAYRLASLDEAVRAVERSSAFVADPKTTHHLD
jgi:hypothetical protein